MHEHNDETLPYRKHALKHIRCNHEYSLLIDICSVIRENGTEKLITEIFDVSVHIFGYAFVFIVITKRANSISPCCLLYTLQYRFPTFLVFMELQSFDNKNGGTVIKNHALLQTASIVPTLRILRLCLLVIL
jgi:hypothetical protein